MATPTAFDLEEMEVLMDHDGVLVKRAAAGEDKTLLWIHAPKGTDFGPALKGLPHDMCCCEHWGMVTKGSMNITTHDGHSLTLKEGDAFHLLPGHLPEFPEDCAWYEFSPREQAERLLSHMGLI